MNIITASGRAIDPANPKASDIDLLDIAAGLASENRFGGRTSLARSHIVGSEVHQLPSVERYEVRIPCKYNVAQHSVLAANLAAFEVTDVDVAVSHGISDRCFVSLVLLHDASEAYLGDIIHPLKVLLPDYQAIEARWEKVIFERFDLLDCYTPENMAQVKGYDQRLFQLEAVTLTPNPSQYLIDMSREASDARERLRGSLPLLGSISCPWDETRSEQEFLNVCKFLSIS